MKFKPLEAMTFAQRFMLTIVIVLIILFALAAFGYFTGGWDVQAEGAAQAPLVRSQWDDHIDELEKQALDDAFKKHIVQLYSIWVTDNYQPRIPPKALTGARNARDAYIRSMESIEKREQAPRR